MTPFSASVLGGTSGYVPKERRTASGKNKPTVAGDMYSLGVVLLLSFSPGAGCVTIQDVETEKITPMDALIQAKRARSALNEDVVDVLEGLLSDTPSLRPSARRILDGVSPSHPEPNPDSYFCRVTEEVPIYWTPTRGRRTRLVTEITNSRILDKIKLAVRPTMPQELGVGFDQAPGWAKLGFNIPKRDPVTNRLIMSGSRMTHNGRN
eukprot:COSAG05_NODE_3711_length_1888_cov_2.528228_1_plen_208_part_00